MTPQTGAPRSPGREVLKKFLALFLSLLIALIIAETIVRIRYGHKLPISPRYVTGAQYNDFKIRGNVPNAKYRHETAEGSWEFRINKQGFRNTRDFNYRKPQGVLRALVLGDSFTIGYEVHQHQTYAAVLERYLEKHGLKAEVINAGMSGSGNAEELVFLEQEGVKYQPDVVILGYFQNDLTDNIRANLYGVENGKLTLKSREYLPAIGVRDFLNSFWPYRFLSEHSYLHGLLNQKATILVRKLVLDRNFEGLGLPGSAPTFGDTSLGRYQEDLSVALVNRIAEVANAHGAYLILLDITRKNLVPSFPAPERLAFVPDGGVYLDTSTWLRNYDGLADLYRAAGGGHWTEIPHMLSAIEIGNVILERMNAGEKSPAASPPPTPQR